MQVNSPYMDPLGLETIKEKQFVSDQSMEKTMNM